MRHPSTARPTRRAMLLAPLLLLVRPRRAAAHAVLVSSVPAAGATIPAGETTVILRFNTRVDATRSRITLLAADGTQTILTIRPARDPETLSAVAMVKAGSQALRWQVLAADGHITRGDIPFKALRT